MYYYWWLVSIMMYLMVLLIYVIGTYIFFGDHKISGVDTVFFGITSIITLSIIPLIKINIYGV
jgi:hypothetical protein